ncbi:MAG: exodeoxyribonuclease VII small subunit [Ignavibacteriaceae bacterium]
MANKKNSNPFESNILRLEEISALLEKDDIGLDEAIHLFEEGVALSKNCLTALNSAELKITELKKKITDMTAKEEDLFE